MTELRPLTAELKIEAHLVELEAMGYTVGAAYEYLQSHRRCPRRCVRARRGVRACGGQRAGWLGWTARGLADFDPSVL